MEASFRIHTPVALPLGKELTEPLLYEIEWVSYLGWTLGTRHSVQPSRILNRGSSVVQPVA